MSFKGGWLAGFAARFPHGLEDAPADARTLPEGTLIANECWYWCGKAKANFPGLHPLPPVRPFGRNSTCRVAGHARKVTDR
jgi:hypothetical protein